MPHRLFFLGAGPLPIEEGIVSQTAHGLRTWQFLSAIEALEYEEVLVVSLVRGHEYEEMPLLGIEEKVFVFGKRIRLIRLDKDGRGFAKKLKKIFIDFAPTAAIGVNTLPAYFLAQLKPECPWWADLNGWSMTEAQSQAFIEKSDTYLPVAWQREAQIVRSADRFSTVSTPQHFALYGELASFGRLNHKTEGYPFSCVIRNGNELSLIDEPISDLQLRGEIVPADAFLVFFSGAYNTWLDDEMLFSGLLSAMKRDDRIHFVSTGGAVSGLSSTTFQRFWKHIEASGFSDRFHFLGWLMRADLLACYEQVDLAINIDRENHETLFGARNRINEWLSYSVPVLSTVGSELTEELRDSEAMIPVRCGDSEGLAEALLLALEGRQYLSRLSEKGLEMAQFQYSYAETTSPFRAWLADPQQAPDRGYRLSLKPSFLARLLFRIRRDGIGFLLHWLQKKIIGRVF